jgi:hypothetical protein
MANLNDVNSNANNDNNEQSVYVTKKPPVQQADNESLKETTKDETQTIQSEEPKSNLNKKCLYCNSSPNRMWRYWRVN